MKRYFTLVLILILSIQLAQAQRVLLVKKLAGIRSYQFLEGERLDAVPLANFRLGVKALPLHDD